MHDVSPHLLASPTSWGWAAIMWKQQFACQPFCVCLLLRFPPFPSLPDHPLSKTTLNDPPTPFMNRCSNILNSPWHLKCAIKEVTHAFHTHKDTFFFVFPVSKCVFICLSLLQRTEMTAVVMNPPPVQPQRAGKYIHLHRLSIQKHFIGSQC